MSYGKIKNSKSVGPHDRSRSTTNPLEKFRPIVEIMPTAASFIDVAGIIRVANSHTARMYGYDTPEEIIGMNGIELLAPEDRMSINEVTEFLKKSDEIRTEAMLLRRDGSRFPAETRISQVRDGEGNPAGCLVILFDITERKRKDEELRKSEERYRRISGAITDYIYSVHVQDGRIVDTIHSPACEAVTGYTSEEFNRDPYLWINMVHEEDRDQVKMMSERIMFGEDVGPVEHRIWRKDGALRWIRNTPVVHHGDDGRVTSYDGLISDITEKHRTETALRESEERYRIITELSTDYVFKISVNEDGSMTMTYVSENLTNLTGRTHEEVTSSLGWRDIIHPDDWLSFVNFQAGLITNSEPGEFECRSFLKDGTIRWIHIFARPLPAPVGGGVTSIVGAIKDVTDRKIAETKLSESEELYRSIIESSPQGMHFYKLKPDGRLVFTGANPAADKILGVKNAQFIGKSIEEAFPTLAQTEVPNRYRDVCEKQSMWNNEQIEYRDDQISGAFFVQAFPIGRDRMVAAFYDITDRKKAEEGIRASLAEKETLLKEIHHRVKNNLQIITSLLSLQSRYFTNVELVRQFNEAQNRIRSMALVHEKLYQSKDFGRIDFRSYIIQLTQEILSSYAAASGRIRLTMDIDETEISIDQAVPCGLIINELVTNAIKHAFPPGFTGAPEIIVSFHTRGAAAKLVIRDNGIGIPEGTIPGKTETLGLSLVPMLAQQLNGEATLDRAEGSGFTIRFTPEPTRRF